MKQKSQWLSQVRTRSNTADETSTPMGSPACLEISTTISSWPRRMASSGSGSSVNIWYSMTSRGTRPSIEMISSPGAKPAA
jgi:hypothetical protein